MSILAQNGISRTAIREENDYYATDPRAMSELLKYESFNQNIWECACGEGNLSEVLKEHGYTVFSSDLSGKARYREIYSKFPPQRVYVFSSRVACSKNNTPEGFKGGVMDYVWMIWEKGKYAPTELKWIYF